MKWIQRKKNCLGFLELLEQSGPAAIAHIHSLFGIRACLPTVCVLRVVCRWKTNKKKIWVPSNFMCRITFTINGKIYHRERENNYFSLRETFKLVIIVNADFAISLVLTQMYVGTSHKHTKASIRIWAHIEQSPYGSVKKEEGFATGLWVSIAICLVLKAFGEIRYCKARKTFYLQWEPGSFFSSINKGERFK